MPTNGSGTAGVELENDRPTLIFGYYILVSSTRMVESVESSAGTCSSDQVPDGPMASDMQALVRAHNPDSQCLGSKSLARGRNEANAVL